MTSDFEPYLLSLADQVCTKAISAGYSSLTQRERVFYCVWTTEAEVNNGGFDQFFLNQAEQLTREAADAFRAIDAIHTASIVESAKAVAGDSTISTDDRDERLERLDQAFLEYRDDLCELLGTYMQNDA